MAVRKILYHPHNVLARKAVEVTKFHDRLHQLLDDMQDTMRLADGVGLAAPQVGISKRIILVDVEGEGVLEVVNPVIADYDTKKSRVLAWEACLSIPDLVGEVSRYPIIKVRGQDRFGNEFEREFSDFTARIFQHEVDHLDGILFIDRAVRTARKDEFNKVHGEQQRNG